MAERRKRGWLGISAVVHGQGSNRVAATASAEEMAQRERVAAIIGARMTSRATSTEQELWQELRDGLFSRHLGYSIVVLPKHLAES